jgi:transcriptional regulator with XRE-family HTH domain
MYLQWPSAREERELTRLGRRLKRRRKQYGLSQVVLAKRAFVDPFVVARMERGELHIIGEREAERVYKALDWTNRDIFAREMLAWIQRRKDGYRRR